MTDPNPHAHNSATTVSRARLLDIATLLGSLDREQLAQQDPVLLLHCEAIDLAVQAAYLLAQYTSEGSPRSDGLPEAASGKLIRAARLLLHAPACPGHAPDAAEVTP